MLFPARLARRSSLLAVLLTLVVMNTLREQVTSGCTVPPLPRRARVRRAEVAERLFPLAERILLSFAVQFTTPCIHQVRPQ